MKFFKDFKRDFAQAVNELMPDTDGNKNTLDSGENLDELPETDSEDTEDYGELSEDELEEILEEVPEETEEDLEEDLIEETLEELETAENSTDVNMRDAVSEAISKEEAQENQETDPIENSDGELTEITPQEEAEETKTETDEAETDETETEEAPEDEETNEETESEADAVAELEAQEMENKENENTAMTEDTTYITEKTTVKGDIETDGNIDLIGTVNGNVTCIGKLILGGNVNGNIMAGELYANQAHIEGEVHVEGSVKIGVGTVIVGNMTAQSAVIAGAVHGDIDVQGPVIVDSTAVIVGNIKSKSVQVNNGAVVEGFCSQCYSDIDVNSYFPDKKTKK